jgi:hypothetical protein
MIKDDNKIRKDTTEHVATDKKLSLFFVFNDNSGGKGMMLENYHIVLWVL